MERFNVWGKIAVFRLQQKKIFFGKTYIFWKILVIQPYTWWIYLDLDLSLVHIIMQNYPVIREWSEADWLDPLLSNQYLLSVSSIGVGVEISFEHNYNNLN